MYSPPVRVPGAVSVSTRPTLKGIHGKRHIARTRNKKNRYRNKLTAQSQDPTVSPSPWFKPPVQNLTEGMGGQIRAGLQ